MATKKSTPPTIDKLPKTNTAAYREALRTYLASATEIDGNPRARKETRLAHMAERFRAEMGWKFGQPAPGTVKLATGQMVRAATEWLQGLAIDVAYMDYDIPAVAARTHGLRKGAEKNFSPRLVRACVANYWPVLGKAVARELVQQDKKAAKAKK